MRIRLAYATGRLVGTGLAEACFRPWEPWVTVQTLCVELVLAFSHLAQHSVSSLPRERRSAEAKLWLANIDGRFVAFQEDPFCDLVKAERLDACKQE